MNRVSNEKPGNSYQSSTTLQKYALNLKFFPVGMVFLTCHMTIPFLLNKTNVGRRQNVMTPGES